MSFLQKIANKIKEKGQKDIYDFKMRLMNKNVMNMKSIEKIDQQKSKKHLSIQVNQKNIKNINLQKEIIRRRQNTSEGSLYNDKKLQPIRNSSHSIYDNSERQLQRKRQTLMQQLKEVDYEMKSVHKDQVLSRIKRNKTQYQDDIATYQKAIMFVEKMNKQRKDQIDKKKKQVLVIRHNVQESIKKFQEYEEERQKQKIKKKQQIQKRIVQRKNKALQRVQINKVSDIIIKQLSQYKLSLPEIYTKSKINEIQSAPILLTSVQENQKTIERVGSVNFLENIKKDEERKAEEMENKIKYQKHIRSIHLQYGQKQRLTIKSRQKQPKRSNNSSRNRQLFNHT